MRLRMTLKPKKHSNIHDKIILVLNGRTLMTGAVICLTIIILVMCLIPTGAAAVFTGKTNKRLPIYGVKTDEKKIAISFDCAWGVDYTDGLISAMEKEDIRSTFFMVEFWAEKYPDYVKKLYEHGFEIGTHSATHPYMSKLTERQMEAELMTSKAAIQKITGEKVKLFRPPYGDYSDRVIETAERVGLTTIQWSVDSLDWKDLSADEIFKRVTNGVKNGSIVLFHNQGLHTLEALPNIIKHLKGEGYEFVTIGELVYKEDYYINPDGIQIKAN